MTEPKYPDVTVQLTGNDGNAFAIIGTVAKALRRTKGDAAAKEFSDAAFASESYDALLLLAQQTVEVR